VTRLHTADKDASGYKLGPGIWILQNAVSAMMITVSNDKRLDKHQVTTEKTERGVQVRRQMRLAK
jgi:hypothetical protein